MHLQISDHFSHIQFSMGVIIYKSSFKV